MAKLAVIGKDVSQSTSPQIHTFIARALGLKMTYERISIEESAFEDRIEELLEEYDGLNVTIPYKLSIIPHLKEIAGDAAAFGAVNTVQTSTRKGYNTDGLGFMQMLSSEGVAVAGKEALVLGAGGAGRSVAKKLADGGAHVCIYDRNLQNAQSVANAFNGVEAVESVLPKSRYLIVNATGVGMHKSVGVSPVTEQIIAGCEVAADLIYVPEKSEFLRLAEAMGKKIINGRAMLFYQAYYADCIYYNLTPSAQTAEMLYAKYLKEEVK